jgi:hypothetical protein
MLIEGRDILSRFISFPFLHRLISYNSFMQTIEGMIEKKQAEITKLEEEIETLKKAQELLGVASEPVKRKGRPKGAKNKVVVEKTTSLKSPKKRTRKALAKKASEAPEES